MSEKKSYKRKKVINEQKLFEKKYTNNILEAERIAINGLKEILKITINGLNEEKPSVSSAAAAATTMPATAATTPAAAEASTTPTAATAAATTSAATKFSYKSSNMTDANMSVFIKKGRVLIGRRHELNTQPIRDMIWNIAGQLSGGSMSICGSSSAMRRKISAALECGNGEKPLIFNHLDEFPIHNGTNPLVFIIGFQQRKQIAIWS
ncbi:hypothetical protein RhiirB3_393211 [Rhizophagus irregularis]|nr:hypothetical protein RhiirB3_393211 [Rhizophagus irregularis]